LESLREWLPNSYVGPELESMHKPERCERLKEGIGSKDGISLVAEQDNEIIGVALGRESAGLCTPNFLGVRKDCRRKGVRSNFLKRFINEANRRKAHKVWLFTSPRLFPAANLYVKDQFLPEGFLRKHTWGLDMIVYSKFVQKGEC